MILGGLNQTEIDLLRKDDINEPFDYLKLWTIFLKD